MASIRPTAGRPLLHRHVVSPTPLATVIGGPAVLQTGGTKLEIGVQGSSARLRPLPPGPRLTHATGCYPIIKLAPPAATERPSASWSGNLRRRLRRSESVGPAHRLYFSFAALKCHAQPLHEPAPERRFQLEIRVACAPAGTSPVGRSDSGMTLVKRRGASGPQNQS